MKNLQYSPSFNRYVLRKINKVHKNKNRSFLLFLKTIRKKNNTQRKQYVKNGVPNSASFKAETNNNYL